MIGQTFDNDLKAGPSYDETFTAHWKLIIKQDGLELSPAMFRAECEGPEGYIRRKEIALRGEVSA